jgi:hypothetical protein
VLQRCGFYFLVETLINSQFFSKSHHFTFYLIAMKFNLVIFFTFIAVCFAGVEYNAESICYCRNADGTTYRCLCQPTQQKHQIDRSSLFQGHGFNQGQRYLNYEHNKNINYEKTWSSYSHHNQIGNQNGFFYSQSYPKYDIKV